MKRVMWWLAVLGSPAVAYAETAFAPCADAPPGMVCIPGGPAIVGSDDGPANERPKRTVEISTFYMDVHEVTVGDYDACVKAKRCADLPNRHQRIMAPFVEEKNPAVPLDWKRAERFCAWAGKRLPTEWEWEKAARGTDGEVYPWGNDPPTCERAQFRECAPKGCKPYPGKDKPWDCVEHATKPVGSFPAGHFGVFDMAGNGFEWTSSWDPGTIAKCGERCRGRNPMGPCDGAYPCAGATQKVLRGGSWYWPSNMTRGSFRRPEVLATGGHRLSARCATSQPWLTRFPPLVLTQTRAVPPDPTPPSAEELATFSAISEDDIMAKETCEEKHRAFTDCRDPAHYIKSNEARRHVWRRYVENLGGGYTGVGVDQNYSFIASARSNWVWLFDYDPTVVRVHHVLRALILAAETPKDFVAFFEDKTGKAALAALDKEYAGNKSLRAYREVFRVARASLLKYYREELRPLKADPLFGWVRNAEHYRYVRLLYQQGRIHIMKGDMLSTKTMAGVAASARKLGVTIHVYYPSNAPESWPFTDQYRRNVTALPFDEQTVVLQTLSGMSSGFGRTSYWHYNVQSGLQQQERLRHKSYYNVKQLIHERVGTDDVDLTVIGLRSE